MNDAFFRLKTIEEVLTANKRLTRRDLLNKLNEGLRDLGEKPIGLDQLDKDIAFLRKRCDADIITRRGQFSGYEYSEHSPRIFTASKRKRTPEEEKDIEFAITVLRGRPDLPMLKMGLEAINRIVNSSFEAEGANTIMLEAGAEGVAGSEWIPVLHHHIKKKKAITIRYKKIGSATEKSYVISPYLLREHRGFWYLIGYNHSAADDGATVIVLATDRIQGTGGAFVEFHQVPDFSPKAYFRHSLGIFHHHKNKPLKVTFWASERSVYFLKIRKVHPTQQIGKSHIENGMPGNIVTIEVLDSDELVNLFLERGTNMKVLGPEELVERIKEKLTAMKGLYDQ